MLSEIGDYEGTKKKIENSYKIRDHFKVCSVIAFGHVNVLEALGYL